MGLAGNALRGAAVFVSISALSLVVGAHLAPWQPAADVAPIEVVPAAPTTGGLGGPTEQHDVSIVRRDGSVATGWLVLPADTEPDAAILIVAGAGRSSRQDLLPLAKSLASAGVAALTIDKRMEGYSLFHRAFDALARDVVDAGRFLSDHSAVRGVGISVLGISEGAWVAPRSAALAPGMFSSVILISPPVVTPLAQSSWIVDRTLVSAPSPIRRISAAGLAAGRPLLPWLNHDADEALSGLASPVLAIWGADDAIAPVASARARLTDIVTAPLTTHVLPGAGHDIATELWIPAATQWLRESHVSATPLHHGVEPSSSLSAASPMAAAWYIDARIHTGIALGVTLLFLLIRRQRKGIGS